ncbi:ACT domain-containing protein ACR4, partial [Bienertia sinuspersici]
FNVTDQDGENITDEEILDYIQQLLGPDSSCLGRLVGVVSSTEYTTIELIGRDRPRLLSELTTVLFDLKCNLVNAEIWTHNTRVTTVIHIIDQEGGYAITDIEKLSRIKELLCNMLVSSHCKEAKTKVSHVATHSERRLHQMMFDDRDYDYEQVGDEEDEDITQASVFGRRIGLSFYFVDAQGPEAYQECYIRHVDGSPVKSEAERQ